MLRKWLKGRKNPAHSDEASLITAPADPLNHFSASAGMVDDLYAHGLINRDAREKALDFVLWQRDWQRFTKLMLLYLGGMFLLSGIVFFFAFNWAAITPMQKLFGLEGAIVLCMTTLFFTGLDNTPGKFVSLLASVLVGVFLAVFGQIYQTGADNWLLFGLWAALILPWTVLSKNVLNWLLWLVIANLALGFLFNFASPFGLFGLTYSLTALFLFNGTILALREIMAIRFGSKWVSSRWTRLVPLLLTLYAAKQTLSRWLHSFLLENIANGNGSLLIPAIIAIMIIMAMLLLYRYIIPDILAYSACWLALFFLLFPAMMAMRIPILLIIPIALIFLTFVTRHLFSVTRTMGERHD